MFCFTIWAIFVCGLKPARPPVRFKKFLEGSPDSYMEWEQKLVYQPPYHWAGVIGFLKGRAVTGLEVVTNNSYQRWVGHDGRHGLITIAPAVGQPFLWLRGPARLSEDKDDMIVRGRRLFDLDANPVAVDGHLAQDRTLGKMIGRHPGLRVPGAWDGFEVAVRAVVGQQISVKAATTMVSRLVNTYGRPIGDDSPGGQDAPARLFPEPEQLVQAPLEEIGLIARRSETIRSLAKAVEQQRIRLHPGGELPIVIEQLTHIPGIGDWTANYIAMRACGHRDAFPAGDLVLRRMMAGVNQPPLTEKKLRTKAQPWRPYRAYATMYLWTHGYHKEKSDR